MSDNTKRAERRKKTNSIWMNRLNNELNSKKYMYRNVNNIDELKNTHTGQLLKNTNTIVKKSSWDKEEIKNYHKKNRFLSKIEIDNSIIEYNENNKTNNLEKIYYLKEQLANCNNDIYEVEELLRDLPERLEGLLQMRKEIEEEICWLQLKSN